MPGPNILFIETDQHRFDALGVHGHPQARTPNLDRLAAEGMDFVHAFTPCPMCLPARCSHLTGQWPSRHGVVFNYDGETWRPLAEGVPTFAAALAAAGYDVRHVGHWHVDRERDPTRFGFAEFVPEGMYGAWRREQGLPDRPKTGWQGGVDPGVRPGQSRPAWAADRVIERLRDRATDRRPFFLSWDLVEPHLPNVVPEPCASMVDPATLPPWPGFAETFEGKPYIQAQQLRTWGVEDWPWERWAPIVARYLGEVALVDAQIGRVLDALGALGLAADTLVVYTSDHGDLCGSHRMVDKHYIMYDDVVRVPLLARWPGRIAPGSRCEAFVSHAVDLARTWCDVAGAAAPATFQGRSLRPLFEGDAAAGRPDVFATFSGNQFGAYSQRMVRDRRWKYVWNAVAEDELYDLATDPAELRNRWRDPACAVELARLRARLVAWMEETGDRLLNHWTRPQLLEGRKR